MFGHQDDKKDHNKKGAPQQDEPQGPPADAAPEPGGGQAGHQADDAAAPAPDDKPSDTGGHDDQPVDDDHAWQHPDEDQALGEEPQEEPAHDEPAHEEPAHDKPEEHDEPPAHDDQPEPISDVIAPAGSGSAQNPVPPMPINARDMTEEDSKTPHELIDIKQKALKELQPLIGQLDQTPEDKFRTLMMIIQASDNQDMLKQAYDIAENIKDEKIRAQALLDVVNEINYFTQHPAQ